MTLKKVLKNIAVCTEGKLRRDSSYLQEGGEDVAIAVCTEGKESGEGTVVTL